MKVGIAGAGAVGCHYGIMLQIAGCDVIYLARGEHFQALKNEGLRHQSQDKEACYPVSVSDDVMSLKDCDVIILTCKTTALALLCEQLKPVIKKYSVLMTMQNGVSAAAVVAEQFPDHAVIAASAFIGVRMQQPGRVIHSAAGHVRLGMWQGDAEQVLNLLLRYWQKSAVDAQLVDDMQPILWHKMLWNCGFNAITALTRRYARDIAADPEMACWVGDAMLETMKAADHVGVILSNDAIQQHLQLTMQAGSVKTSMWQDVELGRMTEIDEMNGYIDDLAQTHGFDAPVNALLASLIRGMSKDSV